MVTPRQKHVGEKIVDRSAERTTRFRVIDSRKAKSHRGEEDCIIDPKFVKPFVHKRRQHSGRTVFRILRRRTPKCFLCHVFVTSLFGRHAQRTTDTLTIKLNAAARSIASYFRQRLDNHGPRFKPVPVRIDDRMRKPTS